LWLPLPELTAQYEILLSGRTEFEENSICQAPDLVKVCVDRLTKKIAAKFPLEPRLWKAIFSMRIR
jgi:hypothetical protein